MSSLLHLSLLWVLHIHPIFGSSVFDWSGSRHRGSLSKRPRRPSPRHRPPAPRGGSPHCSQGGSDSYSLQCVLALSSTGSYYLSDEHFHFNCLNVFIFFNGSLVWSKFGGFGSTIRRTPGNTPQVHCEACTFLKAPYNQLSLCVDFLRLLWTEVVVFSSKRVPFKNPS